MNDLQFYPTPTALALKAWGKFKNREFTRVLEPSAGNGDLAFAAPRDYYSRRVKIDCCEIDISRHPTLRDEGANVVGLDFLELKRGDQYSHIIMNPPFAQGCKHVLHAWDILFDGEIVAILNAETVKNPFSAERGLLAQLIEDHGSVEFIKDAFMDPDAQRKTEVEVALVHLVKQAETSSLVDDLTAGLSQDSRHESQGPDTSGVEQELALPNSFVENLVANFEIAVKVMREAVVAETKAAHYARRLGKTLSEKYSGEKIAGASVRESFGERYDKLKDRAWNHVLSSAQVLSKLSANAQQRVRAEFEKIKTLEFTVSNVYGFLVGLCENQGQIQMGMMLDVFDNIAKYHSENRVFYRGWKSNDAHRTHGMRIKAKRFILPGFETCFSGTFTWTTENRLADFDRVFAMLDGKYDPETGTPKPDYGLVDAIKNDWQALRAGDRVSTDYFDIRYYKGIQTMHFFPKSQAMMDKLNRMVGKARKWLPPEGERVSDAFWLNYESAEKLDKEVRAKAANLSRSHWDNPFVRSNASEFNETLEEALVEVQGKHGIRLEAIEDCSQQMPLLLAA
ncbi:MAG TPA: DUF4942 domain-containing protein [Rhodocyclaceae bacterium]|nr:DUF4942 domain-containing protein [Rhodocyclaceae bacterium]